MSLFLPNYFYTKGYTNSIETYRISSTDCTICRQALIADIHGFVVNGISSFASAINSIIKSNYSWAFIQSYYSLFYLARAFIGINNHGIVYIRQKPYGIKLQISERFRKLNGNTHDVVLSEFKVHFSTMVLLNSQIDNKSPVDWFNQNRNHINYTQSPFSDPTPPIKLYRIENELRKWINTYLYDTTHKYTFDPCHCYIAYPLQLLNYIIDYYIGNNLKNEFIDNDKFTYYQQNIADNNGPITAILSKLKEIAIIQ